MIYKSTDTSENTIDYIEIDKHQSVEYKIKAYSANSISESVVKVSTDGVLVFDTQSGFSSNNGAPLEYTTDNVGYIGRLKVIPTSNNMTFYIDKTVTESEQYAIHTQSGRKILAEEGISLDRESSLASLTIKSDFQFYGAPSTYLVSNVFGPIKTGVDLLGDWQSFNNAEITNGETLQIISSGQNKNFAFQKIEVIPGKAYAVYGTGYYTNPNDVIVKENSLAQKGDAFIRVSESLDQPELVNYQLSSISTPFNQIFLPQTTEIYIKVGYGERNTVTAIENIAVKEIVPFYTFNQNQGTYYLKWSSLNNINLFNNNNTLRLESNTIFYNNVNIGTQVANNQLCISYTTDVVTVSLNGSNAQEFIINNSNKNYILELNPSVLRFSYMNELLSDTELEILSSG